jgi:predicted unusual protein kinase regulating ubiquinone biosynthesis (AarF/ABC1/UbiB family)
MADPENDKTPDENTIGRKISRYAKVSGTMAGLATKLAGERFLGIDIKRDTHAQDLMLALGNLKGPLMKVGQILATIPEALPPEYAKAFQELQSNAPSMGWPFVKRRMKSELGADWQSRFADFEKTAAAAASLGQVHRATLDDGTQLACKLQYPDMRSAIEVDLKQLKVLFGLYERYDSTIATNDIHMELSARLYEELDYILEGKNCSLYRHILKDTDGVHVPKVYKELSTDRLLTTQWLDGKKILDFVDAPLEQRNHIALNLFHAWYIPLYNYGIIHGDPHLGNYTVREDNSINLLDFGCVRVFPPHFINGVIELYHALMKDDTERAVAAYEIWGFKNLNKEVIEILNIWARFLYGPLMEDKKRLIGETKHGVYGRETAQLVHQKLREAGGTVRVPREFVFMDRAALGLGSVFIRLKAEINWFRLFNDMIDRFDPEKVEKDQKAIFKEFELPMPEHLQEKNSQSSN